MIQQLKNELKDLEEKVILIIDKDEIADEKTLTEYFFLDNGDVKKSKQEGPIKEFILMGSRRVICLNGSNELQNGRVDIMSLLEEIQDNLVSLHIPRGHYLVNHLTSGKYNVVTE